MFDAWGGDLGRCGVWQGCCGCEEWGRERMAVISGLVVKFLGRPGINYKPSLNSCSPHFRAQNWEH